MLKKKNRELNNNKIQVLPKEIGNLTKLKVL